MNNLVDAAPAPEPVVDQALQVRSSQVGASFPPAALMRSVVVVQEAVVLDFAQLEAAAMAPLAAPEAAGDENAAPQVIVRGRVALGRVRCFVLTVFCRAVQDVGEQPAVEEAAQAAAISLRHAGDVPAGARAHLHRLIATLCTAAVQSVPMPRSGLEPAGPVQSGISASIESEAARAAGDGVFRPPSDTGDRLSSARSADLHVARGGVVLPWYQYHRKLEDCGAWVYAAFRTPGLVPPLTGHRSSASVALPAIRVLMFVLILVSLGQSVPHEGSEVWRTFHTGLPEREDPFRLLRLHTGRFEAVSGLTPCRSFVVAPSLHAVVSLTPSCLWCCQSMQTPSGWASSIKRRFEQRKRTHGNKEYEVENYVMAFSLLLWTALVRWCRHVDAYDLLQMPATSSVASVVAGVAGHYELGIAAVIASLEALVGSSDLSSVQLLEIARALAALRIMSEAEE